MPTEPRTASPRGRVRAERALVSLLRRSLAGRWGIRAARTYAVLVSLGITATIWIVSRRYGPDGTVLSLLARASAVLSWVCGGLASLALAAPPKDRALADGVTALAASRGMGERAVARAETLATMRLVAEVILLPIAIIALFVLAFVAGGRLEGASGPILGCLVFGLLASAALGAVAAGCRRWGGAQGRTWLIVVLLLPWLLAETVASPRVAGYLSIPGLLGRAWEALTVVS